MRTLRAVFAVHLGFVFLLLTGPLLYAQATVAATGAAPDPTEELSASLIWGLFGAMGLEYIKRKPWLNSLISEQTAFRIQRAWGVLVAGVSALGIHFAFDEVTGTLTITGLAAGAIWDYAKDWLKQWAFQEAAYRGLVRNYRPAKTSD